MARSSPQLAPVTPQGGCRPARAIVRAVTATKHELGLLPLHRVVSYGSTLEVRALLMRLSSHHQRARGEALAVVPPLRAAWTRCLPVAISAAAAKPQLSLCSSEHLSQIQNMSIFQAAHFGSVGRVWVIRLCVGWFGGWAVFSLSFQFLVFQFLVFSFEFLVFSFFTYQK